MHPFVTAVTGQSAPPVTPVTSARPIVAYVQYKTTGDRPPSHRRRNHVLAKEHDLHDGLRGRMRWTSDRIAVLPDPGFTFHRGFLSPVSASARIATDPSNPRSLPGTCVAPEKATPFLPKTPPKPHSWEFFEKSRHFVTVVTSARSPEAHILFKTTGDRPPSHRRRNHVLAKEHDLHDGLRGRMRRTSDRIAVLPDPGFTFHHRFLSPISADARIATDLQRSAPPPWYLRGP